jgi:hypothetical protein
MRFFKKAFAVAMVLAVAAGMQITGAEPAAARNAVKVGVLECTVAPGIGLIVLSSRRLTCRYTPDRGGRTQLYAGRISRVGLDIGFTGRAVIIWGVLAATAGPKNGALAGSYAGLSAQASVGLGVGANALIGGTGRAFILQPFSVTAQTGLNLAAGITGLTLRTP